MKTQTTGFFIMNFDTVPQNHGIYRLHVEDKVSNTLIYITKEAKLQNELCYDQCNKTV